MAQKPTGSVLSDMAIDNYSVKNGLCLEKGYMIYLLLLFILYICMSDPVGKITPTLLLTAFSAIFPTGELHQILNITRCNLLYITSRFFFLILSVDGYWSTWNTWGTCSNNCGQGLQTRTRTCTFPTPRNGGDDCSGLAIEAVSCTGTECPRKS